MPVMESRQQPQTLPLEQQPAKLLSPQGFRGLESHPLRQVLHSAKLKEVASPQPASAWYFPARIQAFLRGNESVRSAMRKFEPIFLKKSQILSGFSC